MADPAGHWTVFASRAERCEACGCWEARDGGWKPTVNQRGSGPLTAAIALVGEALGEDEEEQHQNFVGRAGRKLTQAIRLAGLYREDLWVCNAVRCRPTHPTTGKNRKPTAHEIDCCHGFLDAELRRIHPKVIVTLGDVATQAVLGYRPGGVLDHRGRALWSDVYNCWVVLSLHPAYVLRVPSQVDLLVWDLQRAKEIAESGRPPMPAPVVYEAITDLDRAFQVRDLLLKADRLHFDWETQGHGGVHITKSQGFCISFARQPHEAFVFPRYGQDLRPIWGRDLRTLDEEILKPLLYSEIPKGGWHVAFDNHVTKTMYGAYPTNVRWCGMIAHHTVNNHLGERGHGLKIAADLYTDMGRYDDPLDQWLIQAGYVIEGRADHSQLWRGPEDLVWHYSGADADASFRLEDVLTPRLQAEGVWRLYRNERMPVALEHQEMDRLGVRIDGDKLDTLSETLKDTLEGLELQIRLATGEDDFNPHSTPQLAKHLFETRGLPVLARTETGQPSTREEILKQIEEQDPVIPLVLSYRAYAKIKGTYIDGKPNARGGKKALRAVLDEDGRARMNTRIHGTETFRFVTRAPFAVHTFPKNHPGLPSVRALILPDDGSVFLECDYCIAPDTRVLKADLTWVRAEELNEGDRLVGFDEDLRRGQQHKYREAVVERTSHLRLPCYRITTTQGTVIASSEHAWVARHPVSWPSHQQRPHQFGIRQWVRTKDLQPGDGLSFLSRPWEVDESRDAGYLAGFFDGEGCASSGCRQITFSQNPGPTLDRVLKLLGERGFDSAPSRRRVEGQTGRRGVGDLKTSTPTSRCLQYRILGMAEQLRFLGSIRPTRLWEKASRFWEGRRTWSQTTHPAVVLSVEALGERDVIGFQTSTHTFIAEGFLSHNTQQELTIQAILARQQDLIDALLVHKEDIHDRVMGDLFGKRKADFQVDGTFRDKVAEDEYKLLRSRAKATSFMILYRGGAAKLAKMTGCRHQQGDLACNCVSEAQAFISQYYAKYEAVGVWQYTKIKEARETGRVRSPFGSYRILPSINDRDDPFARSEAERQAVNAPIQISGAHVMARALLRAQERFRGNPPLRAPFPGRVVFTIHDQLNAQVRADLIEEGRALMEQVMTRPHPELGGHGLRIDTAVTHRWGGDPV